MRHTGLKEAYFMLSKQKLKFTKMHGCGNDYIYFSGIDITNPAELALKLTNRNTSVGGDGIVLILPSTVADAKMRMFNANGTEGLMCGNSIRCVGKYLYEQGLVSKLDISIETASGIKQLKLAQDDNKIVAVTVNMGLAQLAPEDVPVILNGARVVQRKLTINGTGYEVTCLSMGNPHAIIFNDDITHFDLQNAGTAFEKANIFPQGINLGIVQMVGRNSLRMRVWERGSGETLASGTAACAAAVSAVLVGFADMDENIEVELAGGHLQVRYTHSGVYLTGECATSYEGTVEI